ncbi:MAG TPA: class I SAM-dependent methyltransferase [Solirubrobacteraceae bacterium]
MSPVHDQAAVGFGRAGADYERGRPGYPVEAVATMVRGLDIGPGRVVLDLAAGTGKLTRVLTGSGARLLAVEPVAGMRDQLARTTPGVDVLDGTAERIPVSDAAVDAVVVAQAFHWFEATAAAAEIHRVLRPGRGLAVIWNSWDESVPWVAEMQEIVHEHAGDAPRQAHSSWQRELESSGRFTAFIETRYANPVAGDRDTVLARVVSTSYIAALERSQHEEVLRRVGEVLDAHPETRDRRRIEMPYDTVLLVGYRREGV